MSQEESIQYRFITNYPCHVYCIKIQKDDVYTSIGYTYWPFLCTHLQHVIAIVKTEREPRGALAGKQVNW